MTARELDVEAAVYVQKELRKREAEKEQRDRDYWTVMFGGEAAGPLEIPEQKDAAIKVLRSEDEVIASSPLGQR